MSELGDSLLDNNAVGVFEKLDIFELLCLIKMRLNLVSKIVDARIHYAAALILADIAPSILNIGYRAIIDCLSVSNS